MARDLASVHHPISDLFPTLDSSGADEFLLTDEQCAAFERDGFLPGVRVLNDEQIEALRTELEQFIEADHAGRELWYEYHSNESDDPDTVLFHALGAWRIGAAFHDLLWNAAFLVPASQLLGGAVRFWHDQLFCKPAKHGGVVAWHQDYSYWTRTTPMAHLTCWIGLDDSTRENGCLHYIPGSHRWELLPMPVIAGDMQGIREVLNDQQARQFAEPRAVELRAGECCFHHPLALHGSYENRSDRPRRATVLNVVRDGVASASDEPLLDGVDVVPAGQTLGGKYFPQLCDAV